jgi:hypothetical protein
MSQPFVTYVKICHLLLINKHPGFLCRLSIEVRSYEVVTKTIPMSGKLFAAIPVSTTSHTQNLQ